MAHLRRACRWRARPSGKCFTVTARERRLRECLLPGLPKRNRVAKCERVPRRIMAGDHDAGVPVRQSHLAERGLCIIEQLVPLARFGDVDFQTLEGLTKHDKQLSCEESHDSVSIIT